MDSRTRAALDPVCSRPIEYVSIPPGSYNQFVISLFAKQEGTGVESNKNYIQEETTMNETTNITTGTKDMPDHIYNLAVLAKKKTEITIERSDLLVSSEKNPENYSGLADRVGACSNLAKYVITNGSFAWDSRKGCWVFYYPATRDVMRDILNENPDLDIFADETSVKPPKRMCLRLSYVEEETRGINGYLKSTVTRTVVWEN